MFAAVAFMPSRPHLLLIDDDELVRRSVVRLLGAEFDVTEAQGAPEALALMETGLRFDVILSDVVMPEMSGIDLLRRLEVVAPHMLGHSVLMTGGVLSPEDRRVFDGLSVRKVAKPFDAARLREAVRAAARAGAGPTHG